MLLLLAAALPTLFWDGGADTAAALRDAGIRAIAVPASNLQNWKSASDLTVQAADPQSAIKAQPPAVNYRMNQAAATSTPWLTENGWRFLRQPGSRFYYEVPARNAALAAAEAYCFGANALIKTDADGLKPLGQMLQFLEGLGSESLPPVADIGYIDDGSAGSGEVMNLMIRGNLLFDVVRQPDKRFKLNVKFGSKEYPAEDAKNPGIMAQLIRSNLTDEKRSLRIYGSQVVVGRVYGSGNHLRLHLLNYTGADRKVDGLRVRVVGEFSKHKISSAGSTGIELLDYSAESGATEFTLPELKTYAVIDLSR
jgi:hypothetical protein